MGKSKYPEFERIACTLLREGADPNDVPGARYRTDA